MLEPMGTLVEGTLDLGLVNLLDGAGAVFSFDCAGGRTGGQGTVRLSVGIEGVEDLIWDLEQGFAHVREEEAKA